MREAILCTNRVAPREAAEPEPKNLAMERVIVPREACLFDRNAEAEGEERDRIDCWSLRIRRTPRCLSRRSGWRHRPPQMETNGAP
jgi:hypothetical protein